MYKQIRHFLGNIKRFLITQFLDNLARKNFLHERRQKHKLVNGKINVGFIFTQEASDWGKSEPIFFALKNDDRFKVSIICIPSWYGEKRIVDVDKTFNDNYEYLNNNPDYKDVEIINGWLGSESFIDLKQFDFSYVFYNSPYPQYSPKSFHPRYVSHFTKICYTPYGFNLSKVFLPISSSWDFFRWIYCVYCCSLGERDFHQDRILRKKTTDYQRSAYCGFPRIYQFMLQNDFYKSAWVFSKNTFRVLWTPRWSTNESIGGSNFLKYKDCLLEYANERRDIDFVFRPHPLAFGNFVKTGQMTLDEVNEYKNKCNTVNIQLDQSGEYAPTFWNSSLLVTDFSSIIIEYLITGNPIIYCETNKSMNLPTEEFIKILSVCYIANNIDDVTSFIEQIKNGIDPMKEKRIKVIEEIFGKDLDKIPDKIVDDLYLDWKKNLIESGLKGDSE